MAEYTGWKPALTAALSKVGETIAVEQITLTAPMAYTLPEGTPSGIVHSVVFTQNNVGGHTVTYDDLPVTVDLAAGASTLVAIWPGGKVTYPWATATPGDVTGLADLENVVFGGRSPVPVPYCAVTAHDANYMRVRHSVSLAPILQAGVEYVIEIIPSQAFTLTAPLQLGSGVAAVYMVDTLAPIGTAFVGGTPWTVTHTPSTEGLWGLRLVGVVANIAAVNIYTMERSGGLVAAVESEPSYAEEDKRHLAHTLNRRTAELRALKNEVDGSLSALLQVQTASGTTQTQTVTGGQSRILRVGLHYGTAAYTPSSSEIFFGGACRKDFTDVRFFDVSGNMLKAQLGELVNMELLEDNNLNKVVKVSASGMLVGFGNGITLSTDNGATFTLITGTTDVTVNASATQARTSMYPVFVDGSDNIYAYAGGILYKLLAADSYATKTPVLDFSWITSGGVTVYPDIQDHAMDADSSGALFVGPYQEQFRTVVYRSTDGGATWAACWTGDDAIHQHPHHIHADPITGRVYVGVDDGGTTYKGARILVTDDSGDTWADITETADALRGRDYYPTYFGAGYRLGGGESYYNGGGTVYRSQDDSTFAIPVSGIGGVRSYADFGTDDLIVAGVQQATGTTENQIIMSEDQGLTWQTIYRRQQAVASSSGKGYRNAHGAVTVQGDTEPCIIMTRDWASNLRSMRVYRGGDHYYREAFVLLDEAPTGPVDITAKR